MYYQAIEDGSLEDIDEELEPTPSKKRKRKKKDDEDEDDAIVSRLSKVR